MSKVWLVEFPTYRYKEDVAELAKKNDLEIVDAKFSASYIKEQVVPEKDAPKLTKVK